MGAFFDSMHIRTENSDVDQKALNNVAKDADCKFLLGMALNGRSARKIVERGKMMVKS
jgi:hypothetical protein